jgi:regulator of sirC expression with transglutaminase-like and TPR domain
LRGLLQIARYGHPNLDEVKIKEIISKIVLSLRDKVKGKTPEEIVNALNQAILYDHGYGGKIRNYSGINNSFINKVMEDRISSPTGLSIMYLLVAKELNIPLVGINSPGHFILGYATEEFKEVDIENGSIINHILFYIDPFNSGQMILPDDYDQWLLQLPYQLEDKKYLPATNKAIVKIVMNNLICALFTTGYRSTAGELLNINEAL